MFTKDTNLEVFLLVKTRALELLCNALLSSAVLHNLPRAVVTGQRARAAVLEPSENQAPGREHRPQ